MKNTFKKKWNVYLLVLYVFLQFCLLGCENNNISQNEQYVSETGSVSFSIVWNDIRNQKVDYSTRNVICGSDDANVAFVTAIIFNSVGSKVAEGGPWECESRQGNILNVPIGNNYSIIIYGYNESSGRTTYCGVKDNITINAGYNDVGQIVAYTFSTEIYEPLDGVTNIDPDRATFSWYETDGAIRYELWISENDDLTSSVIFGRSTPITDLTYTTQPGDLSPFTTYYWTILPVDHSDMRSQFYNSIRSFTTTAEPIPIDFVVGPWTVDYDWDCNGNDGTMIITLNSDYTFTTDEGDSGTWSMTGNQITWIYSMGTTYTGTFNDDFTQMAGTMAVYDWSGTGCWTGSRDVVGIWSLDFDWDCNGSDGVSTWDLNSDYTFTTGYDSSGTWSLTGNQITLTYDIGTVYTGTFNTSFNQMDGTMEDYEGDTGCWAANSY